VIEMRRVQEISEFSEEVRRAAEAIGELKG
jgi:hypothetical protein